MISPAGTWLLSRSIPRRKGLSWRRPWSCSLAICPGSSRHIRALRRRAVGHRLGGFKMAL